MFTLQVVLKDKKFRNKTLISLSNTKHKTTKNSSNFTFWFSPNSTLQLTYHRRTPFQQQTYRHTTPTASTTTKMRL